jgi:predicted N-acetyltransferase YhbS
MNIKIRNASIEDLEDIAEVEASCFPEAEAAAKETFKQRIKTFPESFFLAELGGEVIGFINGCITNNTAIYDELFSDVSKHDPKGNYQAIFGLDVIFKYRNRGIAGMLMNHMIETSKLAGRKGIVLTCKQQLLPYYSKFGFENKGVSNSQHGGAEWYDMILEF